MRIFVLKPLLLLFLLLFCSEIQSAVQTPILYDHTAPARDAGDNREGLDDRKDVDNKARPVVEEESGPVLCSGVAQNMLPQGDRGHDEKSCNKSVLFIENSVSALIQFGNLKLQKRDVSVCGAGERIKPTT